MRETMRTSWIVVLMVLLACGARTELGAPRSTSDAGAGALRQVAPLSTTIVTTQRPTLHWTGAIVARVEVCRDRACQTIEASIDGNGSSATVPSALSPGVHFWRLHPIVNGKPTSASTPVWEFRVPHASTRDASWGVFPDFDGDGVADLVVVPLVARSVTIFPGSPSGVQQTKQVEVGIPVDDILGGTGVVGDIDGDGFGDLAIASATLPSQQGVVYIYRGGPTGLDPKNVSFTINAPPVAADATDFGVNIISAGDLDGDGYADMIVTQPADGAGTEPGRYQVYFGGPNGPTSTPSITLHPPDSNALSGSDVAEAGDFDGDGYPDIVAASVAASETGKPGVYLFRGGPSGPSDATRTLIATIPVDPDCFAPPFSIVPGDLNGDGFADIVLGLEDCNTSNPTPDKVMVIYGGPSHEITLLDEPPAMNGAGHAARIAWDVDGDGFDDVVTGAGIGKTVTGGVVYWGSASGVDDATFTTFGIESNATDPGGWAITGSDLDGDGAEDVTIASLGATKIETFSGDRISLAKKTSVTPPGTTQFYEPFVR